ncbi:MAG: NTPase [Saccharolobus sp.]|jgi:nucleoside-triphosphatase|uniref:NTPase n=1 Tax=Saccharolobus sp. TaxID=2100761 RepID=UPI0028CEA8C8|nr:NTPase [Saccharolobus sp.]MDT7861773.1 NTPase [Saccharolobus sp.]
MNKPLRVFITGNPGVGKTTIFSFIVNELRKRNYKISGFYCPEIREGGRRVGFQIVDIATGERDWLAKENVPGRVKIGRYTVMEENVNRIINITLSNTTSADIIAIDEIGPMELSIEPVRKFIERALNGGKPVIAVVHRKQRVQGDKIYIVTLENRNEIKYEILNFILNSLKN